MWNTNENFRNFLFWMCWQNIQAAAALAFFNYLANISPCKYRPHSHSLQRGLLRCLNRLDKHVSACWEISSMHFCECVLISSPRFARYSRHRRLCKGCIYWELVVAREGVKKIFKGDFRQFHGNW